MSLLLLLALIVTWNDNSDNEDGFTLVRTDQKGIVELINIPANVTQWVSAVPAGVVYCFKVKAYNIKGDSAYSNEACTNYSLNGVLTLTLKP